MSRFVYLVLVTLLAAEMLVSPAKAGRPNDLAEPFTVMALGTAIHRSHGANDHGKYDNAFPTLGDFDGDGRTDLLIGQHTFAPRAGKKKSRDGLLRIYSNTGQNRKPQFGDPIWFDDLVPTGRVPSG